MASSPDKERELKQPLAVEQANNVLMSQTATLSTTNYLNKKKRVKSRRLDLQMQQHHQQDSKIEQLQSNDHLIYVYNAIKLTNYYTNLLFNKHKKQKCDKQKMLKTGTNWRTKQLAQQIPHQDIKLLSETTNMATNSLQTTCKEDESSGQQSGDEVKFIRNQRKLASQFKASLYYLNPLQSPKVNTSSSSSNWLKNTSSPSLLLKTTKQTDQAKNHHCFKVSSLTSILFTSCCIHKFEICLFNLC